MEAVPHDAREIRGRIDVGHGRAGPARDLDPRLLVGVVGRIVEVEEALLARAPSARQEAPARGLPQAFEVALGGERGVGHVYPRIRPLA
jgi:hypothetical protein